MALSDDHLTSSTKWVLNFAERKMDILETLTAEIDAAILTASGVSNVPLEVLNSRQRFPSAFWQKLIDAQVHLELVRKALDKVKKAISDAIHLNRWVELENKRVNCVARAARIICGLQNSITMLVMLHRCDLGIREIFNFRAFARFLGVEHVCRDLPVLTDQETSMVRKAELKDIEKGISDLERRMARVNRELGL